MQRHGIASAVVCALALAAPAAAQDAAKGAALLAEARKAVGGEDKLAAVQRLEVKGQMRASAGNLNIDGDMELFFERPDKFKRKDELTLGGSTGLNIERLQILTATDFVEETAGGNLPGGRGGFGGGGRFGGDAQAQGAPAGQQPQIDPELLKQTQRRNLQLEVSRMLLAVLLTTDAPVTWVGTAQSPDGTADVLEITPAGGTPTRLLLDGATHMPLMLTWTGGGGGGGGLGLPGGLGSFGRGRGGRPGGGGQPGAPAAPPAGAPPAGAGAPPAAGAAPAAAPPAAAPVAPGAEGQAAGQGRRGRGAGGGAQAPVQMFLADYKTVNGLKLPHLITRGSNGETAEELVIKNYRINPNFKADTFKK